MNRIIPSEFFRLRYYGGWSRAKRSGRPAGAVSTKALGRPVGGHTRQAQSMHHQFRGVLAGHAALRMKL